MQKPDLVLTDLDIGDGYALVPFHICFFSDGSKEKSMQVNQYVYESREALETVGSSQNPACPTRCFLEWRSDVSLSDLPLEELVGQSYHAVWWPYSSRGRTQHHR